MGKVSDPAGSPTSLPFGLSTGLSSACPGSPHERRFVAENTVHSATAPVRLSQALPPRVPTRRASSRPGRDELSQSCIECTKFHASGQHPRRPNISRVIVASDGYARGHEANACHRFRESAQRASLDNKAIPAEGPLRHRPGATQHSQRRKYG